MDDLDSERWKGSPLSQYQRHFHQLSFAEAFENSWRCWYWCIHFDSIDINIPGSLGVNRKSRFQCLLLLGCWRYVLFWEGCKEIKFCIKISKGKKRQEPKFVLIEPTSKRTFKDIFNWDWVKNRFTYVWDSKTKTVLPQKTKSHLLLDLILARQLCRIIIIIVVATAIIIIIVNNIL